MEKMHAIVAHGAQDFQYEEIDKPVAGPGEVLIKVDATGICASERSIWKGGDPWSVRAEAAGYDWKPVQYVPGHEYAGTVLKMGEGAAEATGLQIGDMATAEILIPCRTCFYCVRGLYHLCISRTGGVGRSWAEFMKFPAGALVWKIPEGISAQEAALIEPLACSAHGVERANIGPENTVVVSGLGSIGMGMLQIARLRNPYRLIGLDIDDKLCEIALELGADHAFNPKTTDVDAAIKELTDGIGCDIYLEASGSPAALETAFQVLRKRGRLMVYGVYRSKATLDFNEVSEFKELEIVGGHLSPWTYPLVIQYLERGLIDAKRMITDVFPLSEIKQALEAKDKPGHTSIKTLLIP
jgi:threonine dehydrogenase-like Zn-dependent dehydrogenase